MAAVEEKVKQIIVEQLGVDEGEVTPNASFVDDLGADSLDTVELVMALEDGGGSDAIFTKGYKYVFGMYPRATRQFASTAALFKTLTPTPQTYSVSCLHQN